MRGRQSSMLFARKARGTRLRKRDASCVHFSPGSRAIRIMLMERLRGSRRTLVLISVDQGRLASPARVAEQMGLVRRGNWWRRFSRRSSEKVLGGFGKHAPWYNHMPLERFCWSSFWCRRASVGFRESWATHLCNFPPVGGSSALATWASCQLFSWLPFSGGVSCKKVSAF